jgi:hypothetical protein
MTPPAGRPAPAATAPALDQIPLHADVLALLDNEMLICATLGADGWPHRVPLWHVVLDGAVWVSTLAASCKVVNLRRDPRATLLLEDGNHLSELRGAMLRTRAAVHHDAETVASVDAAVAARHGSRRLLPEGFAAALRTQARGAIRFAPLGAVTWDNRRPPVDRRRGGSDQSEGS